MISSSDKEYQQTKQIMLGHEVMNPDFRPLADYIDQTFGVKTINIMYDTIEKGTRPRLGVFFEFEHERESFNENNGIVNYDSRKQQLIAERFRQVIIEKKLNKKRGFFDLWRKPEKPKYNTANIWIYYSAFEPIAKEETIERVTEDKIEQLKAELNCRDLWKISRGFSATTFFLYTDEQVQQYVDSDTRKIWADKYFDLIAPYNEFGYFKRDGFAIYLDSKENFDVNYQGNWYYYYH